MGNGMEDILREWGGLCWDLGSKMGLPCLSISLTCLQAVHFSLPPGLAQQPPHQPPCLHHPPSLFSTWPEELFYSMD